MNLKDIFNSNSLAGTILKDLNYFLNFMQENRFKVTGNKGLLPNNCLPVINLNMSHTLKLTLKREQQFSYPHINALYLLTRTLGLIHVEQIKSSRFLTANREMIAKWNSLNETEQYLNLMHTWLFYSDERLINKGKTASHRSTVEDVRLFFEQRIDKEWTIKNATQQKWELRRTPLYSIALLEMFGLISIKDNEDASQSWLISNITVSDYGKLWAKLFSKLEKSSEIEFLVPLTEKRAKQFYQELSSITSQWKTIFSSPKKTTDQGMHFFKVSLSKDIWRRICVPGIETLDVLAGVILDVFKFDEDHLYQFTYTDKSGSLQTIEYSEFYGSVNPDEVKIGDIDIFIGDSLEFLFDFGDCWRFDVRLEQIDNNTKREKIKLIESAGKAPKQYAYY